MENFLGTVPLLQAEKRLGQSRFRGDRVFWLPLQGLFKCFARTGGIFAEKVKSSEILENIWIFRINSHCGVQMAERLFNLAATFQHLRHFQPRPGRARIQPQRRHQEFFGARKVSS